jgi:hypothetical protein
MAFAQIETGVQKNFNEINDLRAPACAANLLISLKLFLLIVIKKFDSKIRAKECAQHGSEN